MYLLHVGLSSALVLALFCQYLPLVTADLHDAAVSDLNTREEVACPNAEDIAPCNCSVHPGLYHKVLDITCEGIQDEQQLYDIFHSDLPVHNFRILDLDTQNLKSLSADVFGDATFEVVNAMRGSLESVDPETFIRSSSKLIQLELIGNRLTDFPYETLSNYTRLIYFGISRNMITDFPVIQSDILRSISVGNNPIDNMPVGALDGIPNLRQLLMDETIITDLPTGLFASLSKLQIIFMSDGLLANLTERQFEVSSSHVGSIFLDGNQITDIEPDTFKGLIGGTIHLEFNDITILPEATWKPVLDAGVTLRLSYNPLTCGCDVAWLVLEPSYHQFVADATCSNDAGNLVDLDPTWFEENC